MDYTVELQVYSGPLDLLLYLIREHEVDIHNIPISLITDKYIEHLETLRELDINVAGDFLVMASTLMEIKSRTLLPKHEEGEEEEEIEDPRANLVRRLVEYKGYRDLGTLLRHRARIRSRTFSRGREAWVEEETPADEPLRDADLWSLVKSYAGLLKQTLANTPRHIIRDETPIRIYADHILERLRTHGTALLTDFTEGGGDRGTVAGVFLAMLEMVKQRKVTVEQQETFGPIRVTLAEASIGN
jgi:segregation and condensation protein A